MNRLPIQWRRTLILSAAVAFAACSSSSTTNDAQIAGGSGGTTSAGSGGASAHLDAAVASTGGSTDSGAGGSTTSGGGSTGTNNTGVDAAQADRPATGGTGGTGSTVDGAADRSGADAPATDGTQADAPIRDSQGDSQPDVSDLGDRGVGASGEATATLFINDSLNGVVYRYNVTPTSDPVLTGTISALSANTIAVSPAGELFVGQYTDPGSILRFQSILGTPTPNGIVTNPDSHFISSLTFVDSELWALSSAYRACNTDPSNLVRVAFDATGAASPAGIVTTGLNGADRGMLWDPTNRIVYVTQCESQRAIQRYQVAADHAITALTPFTGDSLNNPHAMVMTSWRELIVANAGVASAPGMSLQRFMVDAEGNLTPSGTIDGNGLNMPVGIGIAPWGELFAVSNATAVISRFTFDSSHAATAHGTFQLTAPTTAQSLGVGMPVFVPGASTPVPGDAGATGG